eukprot:scaffold1833_cov255-Pinguiococcus_pyrenoidosus.AAC.6
MVLKRVKFKIWFSSFYASKNVDRNSCCAGVPVFVGWAGFRYKYSDSRLAIRDSLDSTVDVGPATKFRNCRSSSGSESEVRHSVSVPRFL